MSCEYVIYIMWVHLLGMMAFTLKQAQEGNVNLDLKH